MRGLLIGRFQKRVEMTRSKLRAILATNRALDGLPIVANVDFGHTDPILTLPVGGAGRLDALPEAALIEVSPWWGHA